MVPEPSSTDTQEATQREPETPPGRLSTGVSSTDAQEATQREPETPPGPLSTGALEATQLEPVTTTPGQPLGPRQSDDLFSSNDESEFAVHSKPPPELTKAAIKQRIRRIFTPRADGSYLVGEDFVRQWADKSEGGGRDKMMALFEKTAYHREQFIKRCKAIAESIEEESFDIEGEFLTLNDMDRLNFSETRKKGIVRYCSTRPSLVRQSKYGEGEMYWTDTRIKGKISKSRRKVFQEAMEWDEEADSKDEILNRSFDDWTLGVSGDTFQNIIGNDDAVPADEPESLTSSSVMQKVSWPELAKDAAPSSLLHPCKKCVEKHEKKLDLLLQRYDAVKADKLSSLQSQTRT
ncbi:unnamed protein product [Symbiodinium sp. CCMP2456]|nr:unnamed protein product [Symbiodinium sp. CCMP2456]